MIDYLSSKYEIKDKTKIVSALNSINNKKTIIYAVSGKMGAGKDTVGDRVLDLLGNSVSDIKRLSYAIPIRKEIEYISKDYKLLSSDKLTIKYDVEYEQIEKLIKLLGNDSIFERTVNSRNAVQYWGTEVRREQDTNYWVKKLAQLAVDYINSGSSVYISDARFPNEVETIVDFNGKVVRLEVDEKVRIERILKRDNLKPTRAHLAHSSEMVLDDYNFDIVIDGEKPISEVVEIAYSSIIS